MIELYKEDKNVLELIDAERFQKLLGWIKNIAIILFLFEGLSQGLEFGIKHQSTEEFIMNFSLWPMIVGSVAAVTMIAEGVIKKLDEKDPNQKNNSDAIES